jgi:hypothetical protein
MNDQAIGLIRTLTQMAAGWATTQALIRWGIDIDSPALELVLFGAATGAYRSVVSALALRWPALEWLNGWSTGPAY